MLSKKNMTFVILALFILTLACDPLNTATPTPQKNPPLVTIPYDCYRDGYEIYISTDRDYCFAYPTEYYVVKDPNKSEATILKHFDRTPTPEEQQNPNSIPLALQTSITITHYSIPSSSNNLKHFAELDKEACKYKSETISWTIDETHSTLIRIEVEQPPSPELGEPTDITVSETQKTYYIVYANNNTEYYKICFESPTMMSSQSASAKELENVFFLVLDSWNFIEN